MRIIRYQDSSNDQHYAAEDESGKARKISGDLFGHYVVTDELADVQKIVAPVQSRDIICIGLNYREHALETGAEIPKFPVVFLKFSGALQNPGDPIVLPRSLHSDKVDYEGELAVIIGKRCKSVSKENALEYVFGYTIVNDVSARDWQREWGGGQFSRAKSFDTFAPMGPCIVTADEILDPQNLHIRTTVNGETLQDSNTCDMIFDVASIISFLSGSTTLEAGTVILTGTPPGVGMARTPPRWLLEGDTVSIEIEKIGTLTNPVVAESL